MEYQSRTILDETQNVKVYTVKDFPYNKFKNISTVENKNNRYADLICTFDTETTSFTKEECPLLGSDFGFMYLWTACVGGECVYGREWGQFKAFLQMLQFVTGCTGDPALVFYVHNLPFEFQFMRDFFNVGKVFATEKRKVVYCELDNTEFRCSYRLTNMGLDAYTKKTKGVIHKKQSGEDFDYSIKRYPDTPITDNELKYAVWDVLGLYEGLQTTLEEDTLATVPITSTGFVRRDYRESCLVYPGFSNYLIKKKLTAEDYLLCKEAGRGAISGSNHVYTDETLYDLDSEDIKSSYPYQMCTKYFPASKFIKERIHTGPVFDAYLNSSCCLIVWSAENIKLKKYWSIPYISKAKCRYVKGGRCGNGKLYWAKEICMCCTEIDFKIIVNDYSMENIEIHDFRRADRGMLPVPFRRHLLEMFQTKTDLEDGDPYIYMRYKNKINASFGMMLTDILNPEIIYEGGVEPWLEEPVTDIDEALRKHYRKKNNFLSYQDGIWVMAHARDSLHEGMDGVGFDVVQVDTDSVKHLGEHRDVFERINQRIIANAENFDLKPYAIRKNGEKVYLGVWEHEGKEGYRTYRQFRSLGAKKYCFIDYKGEMGITVSGLKKSSAWYLKDKGMIDGFHNGVEFPAKVNGKSCSGRTAHTYCDLDGVRTINVNGHEVTLGSNIAIKDVSYTLGMTSEWFMLVLDGVVDRPPYGDGGAFEGWLD